MHNNLFILKEQKHLLYLRIKTIIPSKQNITTPASHSHIHHSTSTTPSLTLAVPSQPPSYSSTMVCGHIAISLSSISLQ